LDLKVVQVQQVLKEVLDQQEDKGHKVDKDLVLVLKVQQEHKVLKVQMDYHHKVLKVLKVLQLLVPQVLKVLRVVWVFLVLQELKELRDKQEVKVFKGLKVQRV